MVLDVFKTKSLLYKNAETLLKRSDHFHFHFLQTSQHC